MCMVPSRPSPQACASGPVLCQKGSATVPHQSGRLYRWGCSRDFTCSGPPMQAAVTTAGMPSDLGAALRHLSRSALSCRGKSDVSRVRVLDTTPPCVPARTSARAASVPCQRKMLPHQVESIGSELKARRKRGEGWWTDNARKTVVRHPCAVGGGNSLRTREH